MSNVIIPGDLRGRLFRAIATKTKKEASSKLVNMMITDIDSVINAYWYHLADTGMSKAEFNKIKRAVKRRL